MLYQEDERSFFVHDNGWYRLNTVLRLTEKLPVTLVDVSELLWCIENVTLDETERADKTDLSCPILVTHWGERLVTVDGYHRLIKATRCGVSSLPSKYVTEDILKIARMA